MASKQDYQQQQPQQYQQQTPYYEQQGQHPDQQQQIVPAPQYQQHQQQPQQQAQPVYKPQQQQYAQGANVKAQEWQSSLFNCGPVLPCLLGACLPCILIGNTSERMRDPSMQTAETINTDCMLFCGVQWCTGCGWILAMMKRSEIRQRFGIEGDDVGDCCAAYWCTCCVLIQQEKEVQARLAQGPITQGYQPQKEGMQMLAT